MGCNANVVCAESAIEAQHSLLLRDLAEAVRHAAVWELPVRPLRLLLQTRLDKVKGKTEEAGEESGDGTSAQEEDGSFSSRADLER